MHASLTMKKPEKSGKQEFSSRDQNLWLARYREKGFFILKKPLIERSLIETALLRVAMICRGEYDLCRPPWRMWNIGDQKKIQKIDQIHLCDSIFFQLATHEVIRKYVSIFSAGEKVQLWASQLLIKPPNSGDQGNVGWHTDQQNWPFWQGNLFTVWIALSDISTDNGALTFVEGSNKWETRGRGSAYEQNMHDLKKDYSKLMPQNCLWQECPAVLPLGGISLHDARTIHGSYPNQTNNARIGLALHLKTESAQRVRDVNHFGFCDHLDDPSFCPYLCP